MAQNFSADKLESWGKQVADAFIRDRNQLMTPAIEKIASDNKLNREQIQRVCEFANHEANEKIIKTAASKTEEFPVADINVIVKNVKDIPEVAVKEASFDFSKLASYAPDSRVEPLDFFFTGKEKLAMANEALTKLANPNITDNDRARCIIKLSEMKDQLKLKAIEYDSEEFGIKQAMTKIIKDLMEDGHKFEDLYKAAAASKPDNQDSIRQLFDEIGQDLVKKGHIMGYKLASNKLAIQASQMIKRASDESPKFETLKKKQQLELKIGEYMENRCNRHTTNRAVEYMEDTMHKVRGKLRREPENKGVGQEVKTPDLKKQE